MAKRPLDRPGILSLVGERAKHVRVSLQLTGCYCSADYRRRLAALGSASLMMLLGLTLAVTVIRANVTPHTMAMVRGDDRLATAPMMEAIAPSDAQIAYVLARFVRNVKSLSVDPIVVRANWDDALDYVTARGHECSMPMPAMKVHSRKSDSAQSRSPSPKLNEQPKMLSRFAGKNGLSKPTRRTSCERFMGAVSIVFSSQNAPRLISKNPFGLYVDRFTWGRDSIGDASR